MNQFEHILLAQIVMVIIYKLFFRYIFFIEAENNIYQRYVD